MSSLLRRHPIVSYFVLAYLGTWIFRIPNLLGNDGFGLVDYTLSTPALAGLQQLALFGGPFMAAVVVTRVTEGRGSVRRFFRRFGQWRESWRWYALAVIAVPVVVGAGYVLLGSGPTSGANPTPIGVPSAPDTPIAAAIQSLVLYPIFLLGGPLQEEPGWRGFALPRLQQHRHPAAAALVLGVVHTFWHTPQFFNRTWDTPRGDVSQLVAYLVMVVSLSFVLTWLTNGARFSILLPVLGHNGVNWALTVAGLVTGRPVSNTWPAALGLMALAILALAVTRGRLGYRPVSGDAG